jgi:hypothetical protein
MTVNLPTPVAAYFIADRFKRSSSDDPPKPSGYNWPTQTMTATVRSVTSADDAATTAQRDLLLDLFESAGC